MENNLILGVVDNYGFDLLQKFVISLSNTNFKGDVVFFAGPSISPATIRLLQKSGIILIRFNGTSNLPPGNITTMSFKLRQPINYFNYRHYLYYDYILKNSGKYSKILLADVRDVYFQDDPFSFSMDDSLYCAIEGPRAIKDCNYNGSWFKYIYGDEALNQLGGNRISCAGSTWGREAAMVDYLSRMLNEIEKVPNAQIAIDQAIHNYLIYTKTLPSVKFLYNDGGVILTLSYEKNYMIGKDDKVRVGNGLMVKMLHQFDRYPDINALTDKIYFKNRTNKFVKKIYYKIDLKLHKSLLKLGLRKVKS